MLWSKALFLLLASATYVTAQSRWTLLDYHNDGGKNLYVYAIGHYSDGFASHIAYFGRYSTKDSFVRLSTDAGQTWRTIKSDAAIADPVDGHATFPRKFHAIEMPSPGLILMAGDSGTILRTENYGESWEEIRLGRLWGWIPQFQMADSDVGFALQLDTLWKTGDGGKTWNPQIFDTSRLGGFFPVQAHAFSRDRWVVVGLGSKANYPVKFATTTDGGETWTSSMDYDGKIQDRAWSFLDSNNIWYAGSIDTIEWGLPHPDIIRRTWDGGRSWGQLFDDFRGSTRGPVDIEFRDTLNGFLTRFEEVDRTTDGGRTWIPASTGLIYEDDFGYRETLLGLTWVTDDMLVAYSNAGRIWRWVEPSSVDDEERTEPWLHAWRDSDGILVLDYPRADHIDEVTLVDILGRTSHPPGNPANGRFNCAEYPAGVYFVVVRSETMSRQVPVVFY